MNVSKPGYGALLLLTKLLTLAGIAGLILHGTGRHPAGTPESTVRLMALVAPFVAAGCVCVVRKRFFTVRSGH